MQKHVKRYLGKVLPAVLTAPVLVALLPGSASAATYSMDGKNPISAGCSGDATSVKRAAIGTSSWTLGAVELRYSVKCHTAWARITLSEDVWGKAQIVRNSDGKSYNCTKLSYSSSLGSYTCYTAMVYDKDPLSSYAEGWSQYDNVSLHSKTPSY
ncbi:DUF2690 domain-containing protein [Streptomyces sp. NPDC057249]|uniref:DUF2690 domain-containing protein n=1 Tax=Streptomyces sp. NPDC057249 TaxID=3346067 RepID=UPI00363A7274